MGNPLAVSCRMSGGYRANSLSASATSVAATRPVNFYGHLLRRLTGQINQTSTRPSIQADSSHDWHLSLLVFGTCVIALAFSFTPTELHGISSAQAY